MPNSLTIFGGLEKDFAVTTMILRAMDGEENDLGKKRIAVMAPNVEFT
jgi:hypothetical protein